MSLTVCCVLKLGGAYDRSWVRALKRGLSYITGICNNLEDRTCHAQPRILSMTTILRGDEVERGLLSVPVLPGVYEIVHLASSKRYVGSALNIRKRWRSHIRGIEQGKNTTSPYLRNAWRCHGASAFEFRIVAICEPNEVLRIEEWLIGVRDAVRHGYNCRHKPASNAGLALPCSEETKRKIGLANKGKRLGVSSPMKGCTHREQSRRAMSETKRSRGRKITFRGHEMCLADWADSLAITMRALQNRLARGWPLERALTEPSRPSHEEHARWMREKGRILEYNGERMCTAEWARRIGISDRGLRNRLKRGWPVRRALSTRPQKRSA